MTSNAVDPNDKRLLSYKWHDFLTRIPIYHMLEKPPTCEAMMGIWYSAPFLTEPKDKGSKDTLLQYLMGSKVEPKFRNQFLSFENACVDKAAFEILRAACTGHWPNFVACCIKASNKTLSRKDFHLEPLTVDLEVSRYGELVEHIRALIQGEVPIPEPLTALISPPRRKEQDEPACKNPSVSTQTDVSWANLAESDFSQGYLDTTHKEYLLSAIPLVKNIYIKYQQFRTYLPFHIQAVDAVHLCRFLAVEGGSYGPFAGMSNPTAHDMVAVVESLWNNMLLKSMKESANYDSSILSNTKPVDTKVVIRESVSETMSMLGISKDMSGKMEEVLNFIRHDRVKTASSSTPTQFGQTAVKPTDTLAARLLSGSADTQVAGPSKRINLELLQRSGLK